MIKAPGDTRESKMEEKGCSMMNGSSRLLKEVKMTLRERVFLILSVVLMLLRRRGPLI